MNSCYTFEKVTLVVGRMDMVADGPGLEEGSLVVPNEAKLVAHN